MKDCSECEYYKKLAQLWRDEAYEIKGHELSKEWVELTEYDIKGVLGLNESWVSEDCSIPDMIGFAKAIDAKLKERNT